MKKNKLSQPKKKKVDFFSCVDDRNIPIRKSFEPGQYKNESSSFSPEQKKTKNGQKDNNVQKTPENIKTFSYKDENINLKTNNSDQAPISFNNSELEDKIFGFKKKSVQKQKTNLNEESSSNRAKDKKSDIKRSSILKNLTFSSGKQSSKKIIVKESDLDQYKDIIQNNNKTDDNDINNVCNHNNKVNPMYSGILKSSSSEIRNTLSFFINSKFSKKKIEK